MFLKSKICLTVATLYEILAVILLHAPRTCRALFGSTFCMDTVFKYFIVCFAVPALVLLIVMWIFHIINSVHRHHSFMYRARHTVHDVIDAVKSRVSDLVSPEDLEKMLAAALVLGIRKYAQRNANARDAFRDVLNDADIEYTVYTSDDDDDDEDEDSDYNHRNSNTRTQSSQSRSRASSQSSARRSTSGSSNNRRSGNSRSR